MMTEESMPSIDFQTLAFGAEGRAVLRGEAARLSRYLGSGLDEDDLLQAGRIGLLLAAERYDPGRGRFGRYARWWVLAEMAKVIHQSRSPVPIPATVRCQLRKCAALLRLQDDALSAEQLVAELGVSVSQARRLQVLLDGEPEVEADSELLADPHAVDEARLLESMEQERLMGALRQETARLPQREQLILTGLYGLDGKPRRTLRQVGEQVGLSLQRVQQIQRKTLGQLQRRLRSACSRPACVS